MKFNSARVTRMIITILLLLAIGWWIEGSFILLRLLTVGAVLAVLAVLAGIQIYWIKEEKLFLWSILGVVWLVSLWTLQWGRLDGPDSVMWWELSRGNVQDLNWPLFRPKLYVWFLKLFSQYIWVPAVQWVLHSLIIWILFLIVKKQNWGVLAKAGVLLFFGLNSLWLQEKNMLLDTTLFSFLCILCFYLYIQALQGEWSKILLYGFVAGLCTFCRQVADPFLFLGFIGLLCYKATRTKALLGAFILFVSVGWLGLVVNKYQYGVPKRTVALGVSLFTHASYYQWSNPSVEDRKLIEKISGRPQTSLVLWNPNYTSNISWFANALPHQYQRMLESGGMSRVESDKFLVGEYLQWVKSNPFVFLKSGFNEFKRFLFKAEEYTPQSIIGKITAIPQSLERLEKYVLHFPIWFLGLVFVIALSKGYSRVVLSAVSISFAYLVMISFIQLGFTRYVLPVLPFLYLGLGPVFNLYLTRVKGRDLEH